MVEIGKDGKKLIEESKGCQFELKIAKQLNKHIELYKYINEKE